MPLFISKDSHYSIFSPGTHLGLSGGNVEHRTWCLRGAGKDDGWNRNWGTHTDLSTPFPTPSSGKPHSSETQDLSVVFRTRSVYSLFCLFCLFGLGARGFISLKEVFEESQGLVLPRSSRAGDPGAAQLLSLSSSSSTAHALSHACIHPACDLTLRLLTRIHLHTLQYLCALVLVKMPALWDHRAHKQLLQVPVKICFGEKQIKQKHNQCVALLELVRLFRWK